MVVYVECLSADKPWDVVSATCRSSGVAPRACVRVYARVLVQPNLYMHTYIGMRGAALRACAYTAKLLAQLLAKFTHSG